MNRMDNFLKTINCKNTIKIGAAIGLGYSAYEITRSIGLIFSGVVSKATAKMLAELNKQYKTFKDNNKEDSNNG